VLCPKPSYQGHADCWVHDHSSRLGPEMFGQECPAHDPARKRKAEETPWHGSCWLTDGALGGSQFAHPMTAPAVLTVCGVATRRYHPASWPPARQGRSVSPTPRRGPSPLTCPPSRAPSMRSPNQREERYTSGRPWIGIGFTWNWKWMALVDYILVLLHTDTDIIG
jgi:hypothetical protein